MSNALQAGQKEGVDAVTDLGDVGGQATCTEFTVHHRRRRT